MIRNRKRIKLRYAKISMGIKFERALDEAFRDMIRSMVIKPVSTHDSGTLYEND